MNTRRGKANFKNIRILLDGRCSSTVVMLRLVEKIRIEKDAVMQWHTQAGNITTNLKVKVYFILPILSEKNVVAWRCQVEKSTKSRYDMILGRDLLT